MEQLKENLNSRVIRWLFHFEMFLHCFLKTYLYSKTQEYGGGKKRARRVCRTLLLKRLPCVNFHFYFNSFFAKILFPDIFKSMFYLTVGGMRERMRRDLFVVVWWLGRCFSKKQIFHTFLIWHIYYVKLFTT